MDVAGRTFLISPLTRAEQNGTSVVYPTDEVRKLYTKGSQVDEFRAQV